MTEENYEQPVPNLPLLRKAVEWAETEAAKPEGGAWYQKQWSFDVETFLTFSGTHLESRERYLTEAGLSPACGTAYCIAGYVGQLLEPGYEKHEFCDGVHVQDFAANALGLTESEADLLFSGGNDIEDVRLAAEAIASRAGEQL